MARLELTFAEAGPADAQALLDFLKKASRDSDLIVLDQELSLSIEQLSELLDQRLQAADYLSLLVKQDDQVLGLLSITSERTPQLDHIADLFMLVDKAYWGYGLGQLLLTEGLDWVQQTGFIRRLELTVQARNSKALHIYEKFAFRIEGIKPRGAKTKDGEFLDVYMMSRLID